MHLVLGSQGASQKAPRLPFHAAWCGIRRIDAEGSAAASGGGKDRIEGFAGRIVCKIADRGNFRVEAVSDGKMLRLQGKVILKNVFFHQFVERAAGAAGIFIDRYLVALGGKAQCCRHAGKTGTDDRNALRLLRQVIVCRFGFGRQVADGAFQVVHPDGFACLGSAQRAGSAAQPAAEPGGDEREACGVAPLLVRGVETIFTDPVDEVIDLQIQRTCAHAEGRFILQAVLELCEVGGNVGDIFGHAVSPGAVLPPSVIQRCSDPVLVFAITNTRGTPPPRCPPPFHSLRAACPHGGSAHRA